MASLLYNEVRIAYPDGKIYFSESDLNELQHTLKADRRFIGNTSLFRTTTEADTDFYFKKEKDGYILNEIKGNVNEESTKLLLDQLLSLKGINTPLKLTITGYDSTLDYKVGEAVKSVVEIFTPKDIPGDYRNAGGIMPYRESSEFRSGGGIMGCVDQDPNRRDYIVSEGPLEFIIKKKNPADPEKK